MQLPTLVHLPHDVAATDEFALDVDLRDGWPVGERLNALPDGVVLRSLSTWHRRNRGNLYLAVLIGTIAIVVAVEVQPIAVYYFTLLWLAGKVPLIDTFTGVLTVVAGLLEHFPITRGHSRPQRNSFRIPLV